MRIDTSYLLPAVFATLVHLAVLFVISGVWIGEVDRRLDRPRHIEATMVDLDQLSNRRAAQDQSSEEELARAREAEVERRAQQEQERQTEALEQQRQREEQARQQREEQQRQEQQRQAEQQRLEAQRQEQQRAAEEAERQAQLKAQREAEEQARLRAEAERAAEEAERRAAQQAQERERQRQAEERAQAEREQAAAEERARAEAEAKAEAERAARRAAAQERANRVIGDIQTYIQAELTRNWRIPATARNGMKAVIAINLFPSGEIDRATVQESSGDQAFDRSAVQAVLRVGKFDRVADVDPILFERRLRRVLVEFRPEGLRW